MTGNGKQMSKIRELKVIIILAVMLIFCHRLLGVESLKPANLKVLDRPANTMMRDYLTALVDEQFAHRAAMLASLKSAEDWDRHVTLFGIPCLNGRDHFPRERLSVLVSLEKSIEIDILLKRSFSKADPIFPSALISTYPLGTPAPVQLSSTSSATRPKVKQRRKSSAGLSLRHERDS